MIFLPRSTSRGLAVGVIVKVDGLGVGRVLEFRMTADTRAQELGDVGD